MPHKGRQTHAFQTKQPVQTLRKPIRGLGGAATKKKKPTPKVLPKPKPAISPRERRVVEIKKGKKQFVVPEKEARALARIGKAPAGLVDIRAQERLALDIEAEAGQRREDIPGQIGTEELREQVEPSVKPGAAPSAEAEESVIANLLNANMEKGLKIQEGQKEFFDKLFAGTATKEEIIAEGKNFGTGVILTAGATFAAVGGVAAGTALMTSAGVGTITKTVAGFGAEIAAIGGVILGFGKVRDLNRDEINNMKTIAQKMVEGGERIEAFDRQAGTPEFAVEQLQIMIDDLNLAESILIQKAQFNFRYQGSSEFFTDMTLFRNSRNAILRRITAVENVAISGRAQLDPLALAQELNNLPI